MKRTILTTAAICAVLMLGVPAVMADTWQGDESADWGTDGNWADGSAPTSGDAVTIPDVSGAGGANPIVTTEEDAASITLAANATLTINGGDLDVVGNVSASGTITVTSGSLDIGGSLTSSAAISVTGTLTVGTYLSHSSTLTVNTGGAVDVGTYLDSDGNVTISSGATVTAAYLDADANISLVSSAGNGVAKLELDGSNQTSDIASGYYIQVAGTNGSDYGELRITQDHTIQGDGSINGISNYALVSIADAKTLTSQVTVYGAMDIDNVNTSGTFNNEKLVHANQENGTIDVTTATISDSVSSSSSDPRWKVSGYSTTTLRFSDNATGVKKLVGNFDLDEGTLDINEDVTTSGTLDAEAGVTIDVYQGKTFQAS